MSETTPATRPNLDQRRARHAWQAVQSLLSRESTIMDDYAREAKKLPVRIMTSGLGQAIAFIRAKAKSKRGLDRLHDDLTDWVLRQRPIKAAHPDSLVKSIVDGDSLFLRRVTDETLAYLNWLNRFAEAEGLPRGGVAD